MISLIIILCISIVLLIILIVRKVEKFYNETSNFNKFDTIMYINLEKRKDRKKQILCQLKKVGIKEEKITRIDAVYEKYNGHIGCAKSHLKALQLAKQKNYKNIVVFEDDFVFTLDKNDVNNKIDRFLEDYGNNWDIVQLTTVFKNLEDIEKDYLKKVNYASTSSGYIINSRFFTKLIKNLSEAIDHMVKEMIEFHKENSNKKKYETGYALDQYWGSLQKNSAWYIFYPYLGTQGGDAGASSIMEKVEDFTNKIEMFNINV